MIWGIWISYLSHCGVEVAIDDSWREGIPQWRHWKFCSWMFQVWLPGWDWVGVMPGSWGSGIWIASRSQGGPNSTGGDIMPWIQPESKIAGSQAINITMIIAGQAVKRWIQDPLLIVVHGYLSWDSIFPSHTHSHTFRYLLSPWGRGAAPTMGRREGGDGSSGWIDWSRYKIQGEGDILCVIFQLTFVH